MNYQDLLEFYKQIYNFTPIALNSKPFEELNFEGLPSLLLNFEPYLVEGAVIPLQSSVEIFPTSATFGENNEILFSDLLVKSKPTIANPQSYSRSHQFHQCGHDIAKSKHINYNGTLPKTDRYYESIDKLKETYKDDFKDSFYLIKTFQDLQNDPNNVKPTIDVVRIASLELDATAANDIVDNYRN